MYPHDEDEDQMRSGLPKIIVFPDLVTYEVRQPNGDWTPLFAHTAQVQDGVLMLLRLIFVDPECTQPSTVPAGFYPPGEWRGCRTDERGYQRKSEFDIH